MRKLSLVIAGLLLISVFTYGMPRIVAAATLVFTPSFGLPSTTVAVSGSGYSTDEGCTLFNSSGVIGAVLSCDIHSGTLSGVFVVSGSAVPNQYLVQLIGSISGLLASNYFFVLQSVTVTTTSVSTTTTGTTATTTTTAISTTTATSTVTSYTTTSVTLTPSVSIGSWQGAGQHIVFSGNGFASTDSSCSVSSASLVSSFHCDISGGTVSGWFIADSNAPSGTYIVSVTGSPQGDSGSGMFTMPARPTLALTPNAAPVGTLINVDGSHYAGSTCLLTSSGLIAAQSCTITSGTLSGAFTVSSTASLGSYTVTATSNAETTSATFTVLPVTTAVYYTTTASTPFYTTTATSPWYTTTATGTYYTTTATTPYYTASTNAPTLLLNPAWGTPGSYVTFTASGFTTSDTGCSVSSALLASSASCTVTGGGYFYGSFTISSSVGGGDYQVTVFGSPYGDSASHVFSVSPVATSTSTVSTTITQPSYVYTPYTYTMNQYVYQTSLVTSTVTSYYHTGTTTSTSTSIVASTTGTATVSQTQTLTNYETSTSLFLFTQTVCPTGYVMGVDGSCVLEQGSGPTIPLIFGQPWYVALGLLGICAVGAGFLFYKLNRGKVPLRLGGLGLGIGKRKPLTPAIPSSVSSAKVTSGESLTGLAPFFAGLPRPAEPGRTGEASAPPTTAATSQALVPSDNKIRCQVCGSYVDRDKKKCRVCGVDLSVSEGKTTSRMEQENAMEGLNRIEF